MMNRLRTLVQSINFDAARIGHVLIILKVRQTQVRDIFMLSTHYKQEKVSTWLIHFKYKPAEALYDKAFPNFYIKPRYKNVHSLLGLISLYCPLNIQSVQ